MKISVIIPARNEEGNLLRLLRSIQESEPKPWEVIVVDDHSTDRTAEIATENGATVIANPELPAGWTGKTWGLWNGARMATGDLLFFVDADCWLKPQGLGQFTSYFRSDAERVAVSALPYHEIQSSYENLSLFFNLFMALGTGVIGVFAKKEDQKLFGQSLMIARSTYLRLGGHSQVRSAILENFTLTGFLRAEGMECIALLGKNVLHFRMYPQGLGALIEGWTKAFAQGAKGASSKLLFLSVIWSSLAMTSFTCFWVDWRIALPTYLAFCVHIGLLARRIANFSWLAIAFFPVFFTFFLVVFMRSLLLSKTGRHVTWRGRKIPS